MKNELSFRQFTGGPVETHAYLVTLPQGNLLIDAPEGAADYFRDVPVDLLLLTHSHFDHVMDAAKIVREKKCGALMHRTTEEHLADKMLNKRFGLPIEIEPVKATTYLEESKQQDLLGAFFDIFEVPGHCPGSICLYNEPTNMLFGGDVLFAGGVGRWDLPGGDGKLLIAGIRKKLLTLPPETRVFPGHGPETTIGIEAATNGYLAS
jgi:hydroxyacylglutathione hydrolase